MNHTAYLSNDGEYTFFTFGDRTISFLTSRNLEKYLEIVEWDHGYIVVLSKNYNREQEEDYIDLIPIIETFWRTHTRVDCKCNGNDIVWDIRVREMKN